MVIITRHSCDHLFVLWRLVAGQVYVVRNLNQDADKLQVLKTMRVRRRERGEKREGQERAGAQVEEGVGRKQ